MATIFLGLGSNIQPESNLRLAFRELEERFSVVNRSSVYRNQSIGFSGDDFLNMVIEAETSMSPESVLREIEEIHALAGRHRGGTRYSARELDIDLLLYDQLVVESGTLRLPRRDILRYGFVLLPLAEIAPELHHPVSGLAIGAHSAEFDYSGHPLTIIDVKL